MGAFLGMSQDVNMGFWSLYLVDGLLACLRKGGRGSVQQQEVRVKEAIVRLIEAIA